MKSSSAIWSDPRVTAFTGSVPTPEQIETGFHEDLKKRDTPYGFRTVIETESGLHVGDCGLLQKEIEGRAEIELVYFFHPRHWGKGFATEAASALRDRGLNDLGLPRLISLIHKDNGASQRVAEKIGMAFEREILTKSGNPRSLFAVGRARDGI